ncbi:hypothetical protein F4861DRAFT_65648 [Xylaria intraflava]|nr:hypothetical protein F4861DRAFT_65648 [Xylaria intraflava]
MFFAAILPAVSAILMSFTRFATADIAIMPCPTAETDPTFMISVFTGGIGRYTGGQSFTFYLNNTFTDYHSGCSGSVGNGAADSGMQWCSTRVPGWNASFVMTSEHKINIGNDFLCSQTDGTIATAHADGSVNLDITTGVNGRLSMTPANVDFPATIAMV